MNTEVPFHVILHDNKCWTISLHMKVQSCSSMGGVSWQCGNFEQDGNEGQTYTYNKKKKREFLGYILGKKDLITLHSVYMAQEERVSHVMSLYNDMEMDEMGGMLRWLELQIAESYSDPCVIT